MPEPTSPGSPLFDHEKLEVYRLELGFVAWAGELLEEVSGKPTKRTAEVCDQLDRASLSVLLNTAEANGRRQRPQRAKQFDDARGSATECAACLDALVAKKVFSEERVLNGKRTLSQIVRMLHGLVIRFEADVLKEDEVPYRTENAGPEGQ